VRYFFLILLAFSPLFSVDHQQEEFLREILENEQQLCEVNPAWHTKIINTYTDGTIQTLLFINEAEELVKRIDYYPTGARQAETDGLGKTQFIKNGASISFYENGSLKQAVSYVKDKKEGLLQQFHPNGGPAFIAIFSNDLLNGPAKAFNKDNTLVLKIQYKQGQPHGEAFEYHSDGTIQKKLRYINGLLHGSTIENHPNGALKSKKHYCLGIEITKKADLYSEDGNLIETGSYQLGRKTGLFIQFYPSGQKKHSICYVNDKKDGEEHYFDEQGKIIASNRYRLDEPIETNIKITPQGVVKTVYKGTEAQCNEYDTQGKKISQYTLRNGALDGDYLEWNSELKLIKELHYKKGMLHGKQKLFYNDQKPYVIANFTDGKRDGEYLEFSKNGVQILAYTFIRDLPHGSCQQFYPTGKMRETISYKNGLQHGASQYLSPNGVILFEGAFENDIAVGKAVERYENGQMESTYNYVNGMLDGKIDRFYEDGSLQSQKEFRKGTPIGTHVEFYPKNTKQQIKSRVHFNENGLLEGEAIRYFPIEGIQAQCFYRNGQLDGKKQFFAEDGTLLLDSNYQLGQLNGPFFQKKSTGIEVHAQYKNNRLTGTYIEYYPALETAKIKALETTFINGKIEGTSISYNEQGQKIVEQEFANGKRQGAARMYDDKGALTVEAHFKNGKQDGTMVEYFPNGKIFRTRMFAQDLQDGLETIYYDNGVKAKECTYKQGKPHGLLLEWSPENILLFEAEFQDGLRNGKFNKYDETGALRIKQTFKNDILQSKEKF